MFVRFMGLLSQKKAAEESKRKKQQEYVLHWKNLCRK